jgi:hypothetical protein
MLQFPFWLAIPTGVSPQQHQESGACQPWILSTAEKMAAFLGNHKDGRWETKLVDRYSAPAVFSRLVAAGYTTICLDTDDGTGRTIIALAEILAALR